MSFILVEEMLNVLIDNYSGFICLVLFLLVGNSLDESADGLLKCLNLLNKIVIGCFKSINMLLESEA